MEKPDANFITPEWSVIGQIMRQPSPTHLHESLDVSQWWGCDCKVIRDISSIREHQGFCHWDVQKTPPLVQVEKRAEKALANERVLVDASDIASSGAPGSRVKG